MNAGSIRFWLQVGIPVMMPGILGTFNMLCCQRGGRLRDAVPAHQ